MEIYHNPRCSKSREALGLLEKNGVQPTITKYLEDVPTAEEIENLLQKLGLKAEEIVRKGEKDYKDHFKGKNINDKEWIAAFQKYPKLIERPIFIVGDKAVIGRPPEKVLTLIK